MSAARRAPVLAAGALVWREHEGRLEVLLIHRPRYDDWSWPKGKLDAGESLPVAAVREVAEETGLTVRLGTPLPGLHYRLRNGRTKEVHYWTATALPDDSAAALARPPVPRSLDEVDELRWATPKKAAQLLTRGADRKPLRALVEMHEKGRLQTRAVVVVRHAQAVGRSTWDGPEAERPLTPSGTAQADGLVPLLAAFGVESIVTSPWERCAATTTPYAKASGVVPAFEPALTEDAHRAAPDAVRDVVGTLLSGAGAEGSVALCTHRPVLPTVLDTLAGLAPGRVRRALPRKDPYLRPAGIVVAHVRQDAPAVRITDLEIQGAARDRRR